MHKRGDFISLLKSRRRRQLFSYFYLNLEFFNIRNAKYKIQKLKIQKFKTSKFKTSNTFLRFKIPNLKMKSKFKI